MLAITGTQTVIQAESQADGILTRKQSQAWWLALWPVLKSCELWSVCVLPPQLTHCSGIHGHLSPVSCLPSFLSHDFFSYNDSFLGDYRLWSLSIGSMAYGASTGRKGQPQGKRCSSVGRLFTQHALGSNPSTRENQAW